MNYEEALGSNHPPRLRSFDLAEDQKRQLSILNLSLAQIWMLSSELEASIYVFEHWHQLAAAAKEEYTALSLDIARRSQESPGDFAHSERDARSQLDAMSNRFNALAAVAARDAPMTLWNFGDALKYLIAQLKPDGELNGRIDLPAIKDAYAEFLREFPDINEIRNHIAHRGANSVKLRNEDRYKKNSLKQSYRDPGFIQASSRTYVGLSLKDTKLLCTHGGEMREIVLDRSLIERVEQIKKKVWNAHYRATVEAARP